MSAAPKALLIGVNDYDAGEAISDLRGTGNDVMLMRDALAARGVSDITILADAVPGAARPTRAAIMDALESLAETAAADDLVMIHFSGHGSRQPDRNGDETDGWDEVILPIDTQPAERGSGLYPNAITDDEIGAAVDAIRRTGADVWLVLDSCHSGTALRGGTAQMAARYVEPAILGNKSAPTFSTGPVFSDSDLPTGAGNVMAFYSAQPNEKALESNMADEGAPEEWFGFFTSRLAAQMQGTGPLSYRQLFQATLRAMNDSKITGASTIQTPLWEGDLIDRPILAAGSAAEVQRFEITDGKLMAGQIHGLPDGTVVGLVENVTDRADAVIGAAQIERAGPMQSSLRAVAAECVANAATLCPSIGVLPPQARFAQVVSRPLDQLVRVAPPIDATTGEALMPDHPAYAALSQAANDTPKLTLDTSQADVATLWDGQALWFGKRTQIEDQPVGLKWQPGAEPLAPLLARIEHAVSLSKLLQPLTSPGLSMDRPPVAITTTLEPSRIEDIAAPGSGIAPAEECKAASAKRDKDDDRPLKTADPLKQCDKLRFSGQAHGPGSYDVNRIQITSQFCVIPRHKRIDDFMQAAKVGSNLIVCSDCPDGYSAGDEEAYFIISDAKANAPPFNLRGLLENCAGQDPTKRGERKAAIDFLNSVVQTPKLRSGFGSFGAPTLWVQHVTWTVLPKPVVLRGREQTQ